MHRGKIGRKKEVRVSSVEEVEDVGFKFATADQHRHHFKKIVCGTEMKYCSMELKCIE